MKLIGIVISCFIIGIINATLFDPDNWEFWFISIGWGVFVAGLIWEEY